MSAAAVTRVTGSLVEARPLRDVGLYELVRVGARGLLGEVIRVDGEVATLQIHEDTTGLAVGAPVAATGGPLAVELGPGLLGAILDGVGRPLARLAAAGGDFLAPGATAPTLDPTRRWRFVARAAAGELVGPGDLLGEVEERPGFVHRVLVPPGVGGTLGALGSGAYTVTEPIGTLADGTPLHLAQRWALRRPRPVDARLPVGAPLVTGQRILDLLFPLAEGGAVAVPGGFGTGKTVIEHGLARHAAADVVVFVGCGERGNEMAEVLQDFPMERTILVVNTSNMPVVAREASVYLGVSIAEYYRDQGYRVAVMVDSLSRWAEALRDIAARLQEMPGEEGYPTSLASRLGQLYERAGVARCLGAPARTGAVSLVCAVSPPGGDFSEPVTQASLRVAGALWALDPALAQKRQFPAVDWGTSYSLYADATAAWFAERAGVDWAGARAALLALLHRDAELREIAGLLGHDALQDRDRIAIEIARLVREHLLGQSAFDPIDRASPVEKTGRMAALAVAALAAAEAALAAGAAADELDLAAVRRAFAGLRAAPADELAARAAAVERAIAALGGPR